MARAAPSAADGDAVPRFETLYRDCYEDLLRYALRRTDLPETAADVVAESFLVAWRRIGEIPTDRGRAWLFGVARKVLANQYRADRRGAELAARLRADLAQVSVVQPEVPGDVSAAFRSLTEPDRELLRLVAWEGLSTGELAVAFDCSANAIRLRLHRARRRFARALRDRTGTAPAMETATSSWSTP